MQLSRKNNKITDIELGHEAVKQLKKHPASLDVTEREVDASSLRLALQLRKGKLDTSYMVCNVGDSVNYLRWSSSVHPCVLPTKKYLYVLGGQLFTNANCRGWSALLPPSGPWPEGNGDVRAASKAVSSTDPRAQWQCVYQ